jgi:hypothetical protein
VTLKKRALQVSITILTSLLLTGCLTDQVPDNHPCHVDLAKCKDLAKCECYSYKMVDGNRVIYQFDRMVNITDLDGGWMFPKGELEKVLQWGRNEKAACDNQGN